MAVDALERPAVRARHAVQLFLGLGERHVHAAFAAAAAFQQVLQRERGLARARVALDEVDAVRGEAAAEDVVEAGDAGRDGCCVRVRLHGSEDLSFCGRTVTKRDRATKPQRPEFGVVGWLQGCRTPLWGLTRQRRRAMPGAWGEREKSLASRVPSFLLLQRWQDGAPTLKRPLRVARASCSQRARCGWVSVDWGCARKPHRRPRFLSCAWRAGKWVMPVHSASGRSSPPPAREGRRRPASAPSMARRCLSRA